MSARTDLIRSVYDAANAGRDPHVWLREHATEGSVLYAPGLGADVRGREAVADLLATYFDEASPRYRLVGEPIEQGNFVVVFPEVEVRGKTFTTCAVWRFDGDRINGQWVLRG